MQSVIRRDSCEWLDPQSRINTNVYLIHSTPSSRPHDLRYPSTLVWEQNADPKTTVTVAIAADSKQMSEMHQVTFFE
jgi:hypothetical protein